MRNWILCLAAMLCGFGLLRAPQTSAQQEGFSGPGRYRIENVASGKSLDVKQEDKRTVQQWATHGAAHQQWDVEDAGNGFYTLRSADNGKVLDFADNRARDGVTLIVADLRGSDYQLWKINNTGNGQCTIVAKAGKALDVPALARMQDGTKLQVMTEHGLENQRFRFFRLGDLPNTVGGVRPRDREIIGRPTPTPTPALDRYTGPGRYAVQIVHSNKYLDLKLEDQETLQQWGSSGARNQQWEIEDAGGGYVYIRSGENGKALEVASKNPTDGTAVFVRNNRSNTDTQKWRIVDQGNGEFMIMSRAGNRALDLAEFNQNDGGKLYVWKETRATNQRFRFARVTQGETYSGGRVRGRVTPTPTPTPTPAPYTPGKLVWRGRVDIEILLDVRGGVVTERTVTGRSFNNGRILSSSGAMPLGELTVRVRNIKVRGSVEVVEQPSAANNWTAVLRVRDPEKDGADYEFEVSW